MVKEESAGHAAGNAISNKIATTENVLTAEHHIHIPELSSAEDSIFLNVDVKVIFLKHHHNQFETTVTLLCL